MFFNWCYYQSSNDLYFRIHVLLTKTLLPWQKKIYWRFPWFQRDKVFFCFCLKMLLSISCSLTWWYCLPLRDSLVDINWKPKKKLSLSLALSLTHSLSTVSLFKCPAVFLYLNLFSVHLLVSLWLSLSLALSL